MRYLKRLIEYIFHSDRFYKFDELQVGGHCGICGRWIKSIICEKDWAITICKNCQK